MNTDKRSRSTNAFTLTELLVALGIVTILLGLGLSGYRSLMDKGRQAREISAARNLMVAYHLYAQDNNGQLLPGYKDDPGVENFEGQALHSPISGRYPWRLAPYISTVEGTLVYNGNEEVLMENERDYLVSVRPNLGINANFVGGHYGNSSLLRPGPRMESRLGRWYVSTAAQAHRPSRLIVFASARYGADGENTPGYFEIQPPNAISKNWSEDPFEEDGMPADHGFIDLRWSGRAVAAMLDGSAQLLDEAQLRDMRHWSNGASMANNPDYTITY